jgi:hypothetical protein
VHRVERKIEVERPADVVWAELPAFAGGAQVVDRREGELLSWRHPDDGDTWSASLIALSPKRTRVDLALEHDPHGLVDRASDALGALDRRVEADVARLKTQVESGTPAPE